MSLPRPPRQNYVARLWDYDYLLGKSDDECCYSLSEREIQILLAQIDYIGWKTRYKPTSTEIDQSIILQWQGNLARKLMSGCCGDDEQIHRYLPDGNYQSSDDGGITWVDDPLGDPRHAAILAPPLPGDPSSSLKCAAADNIRDQYQVMRDNTIALLTGGTTLLAIVAGLVGLIGAILAISIVGVSFGVILFGLAAAILALTPEEVEEQIDAEALETFKCIVYCHLDTSGRIQTGEFDDILTDIALLFSGFPETFFYSITASMGATGLNNAATMGVAMAADCDECGCELSCDSPEDLAEKIVYGTVTATGIYDGHPGLEVESEFAGGTYVIRWGEIEIPSPPNMCCYFTDYVVMEGSVLSSFYTDCAGTGHGATPASHTVAHLDLYNSGAPFKARLVFGV